MATEEGYLKSKLSVDKAVFERIYVFNNLPRQRCQVEISRCDVFRFMHVFDSLCELGWIWFDMKSLMVDR